MHIKKQYLLTFAILSAIFFSVPSWAKDFSYQGKVSGMVCAFCAYNVSKKISQLPGVDKASVNVNLKAGKVDFNAHVPIERQSVEKLFAETGYKLVEFGQVNNATFHPLKYSSQSLITLKFSSDNIVMLDAVLDGFGELATIKKSKITINAPNSSEINLLKPILSGRKKEIQVKFTPIQSKTIELKLYQAVSQNVKQSN